MKWGWALLVCAVLGFGTGMVMGFLGYSNDTQMIMGGITLTALYLLYEITEVSYKLDELMKGGKK